MLRLLRRIRPGAVQLPGYQPLLEYSSTHFHTNMHLSMYLGTIAVYKQVTCNSDSGPTATGAFAVYSGTSDSGHS